MKTPTDIRILSAIYNTYYETFTNYRNEKNEPTRRAKIYVPIDCKVIGDKLGVDSEIIFGRLYYYLNEKYSYKKADGARNAKVEFFALRIGEEEKCIQFSLMASVLARLRDERKRYLAATGIALFSLLVSITAVLIAAL